MYKVKLHNAKQVKFVVHSSGLMVKEIENKKNNTMKVKKTIAKLKRIDNLYLKFILTIIAVALVYLCFELEYIVKDIVKVLHDISHNLHSIAWPSYG